MLNKDQHASQDVMSWRLGVGGKLIRLGPNRPVGACSKSDRIRPMTGRAGKSEPSVRTNADSILQDRIKSPKADVKLTDLYGVDSSQKESLSLRILLDAIISDQCCIRFESRISAIESRTLWRRNLPKFSWQSNGVDIKKKQQRLDWLAIFPQKISTI